MSQQLHKQNQAVDQNRNSQRNQEIIQNQNYIQPITEWQVEFYNVEDMWRKNNEVKYNNYFDNQQNIAKEVEVTQKILGDSSRIVEKFNLVYPQAYQVVRSVRQAQTQSLNQLNQQYLDSFENNRFSLDLNNLNDKILFIFISHSSLIQNREQRIKIDLQQETEVLKSLAHFYKTGNIIQKNYLHLINLDIHQISQILKDESSILSYKSLCDQKADYNTIQFEFVNQMKIIMKNQISNLSDQIIQRHERILNDIQSSLLIIENIDLQVVYSNCAAAKALALCKINFNIDQIAILLEELEETNNKFCKEILEQISLFQKDKRNVLQSQNTSLVQILAEQILDIIILETQKQIQFQQALDMTQSNIVLANNSISRQIPRELQGKVNNLTKLDSSWIDLLQQYLPNNSDAQNTNQPNQENQFLLALLQLQEQSLLDIVNNLYSELQFIPKLVLQRLYQEQNNQKQNPIFNILAFPNQQNEMIFQWFGKQVCLSRIFNNYIINYINQSLAIAHNSNNQQHFQQQQLQTLENLYQSLFLLLLPYFCEKEMNELQISTVSQFKLYFLKYFRQLNYGLSQKQHYIAQIQEQVKNKILNNFIQEQEFIEIKEINYDNLQFQNNIVSVERDFQNKILRWRVQLQDRYQIMFGKNDKFIDSMSQSTLHFLRDSNTVKMVEVSIVLNDQIQQQNQQEFKDCCLKVNIIFQQSIDTLFFLSSNIQSSYLFYLTLFVLRNYHTQEISIINKINQNLFNLDFEQYNYKLLEFINSLEQEIVNYNLEQEQLRIQQQQQKELEDRQYQQSLPQQSVENRNQLQQDNQTQKIDNTWNQNNYLPQIDSTLQSQSTHFQAQFDGQNNNYNQNVNLQLQQQQFQNQNLNYQQNYYNNQGYQQSQDLRNERNPENTNQQNVCKQSQTQYQNINQIEYQQNNQQQYMNQQQQQQQQFQNQNLIYQQNYQNNQGFQQSQDLRDERNSENSNQQDVCKQSQTQYQNINQIEYQQNNQQLYMNQQQQQQQFQNQNLIYQQNYQNNQGFQQSQDLRDERNSENTNQQNVCMQSQTQYQNINQIEYQQNKQQQYVNQQQQQQIQPKISQQNQQIRQHVTHLVAAGDFAYGLGACQDFQFCQQQIFYQEGNNLQNKQISNRNTQALLNQQFQSQKCQNSQNNSLNKSQYELQDQRNLQQQGKPYSIENKNEYQEKEIKKQQEDNLSLQLQNNSQLSFQNQIGQNYNPFQVQNQNMQKEFKQSDESDIKSQPSNYSNISLQGDNNQQQSNMQQNQSNGIQNFNQGQNFQFEERKNDYNQITLITNSQSQVCSQTSTKQDFKQENLSSLQLQNQLNQNYNQLDPSKISLQEGINQSQSNMQQNQSNYIQYANQAQNFQFEEKKNDQNQIILTTTNSQSQLCNQTAIQQDFKQEKLSSGLIKNEFNQNQQFDQASNQKEAFKIQNEEKAINQNTESCINLQQMGTQQNSQPNLDEYEIIQSYQSSQLNSNLVMQEQDNLVIVDQIDQIDQINIQFKESIQFHKK
ncbi:hypothetical protein TTHERM_00298290 (macronuclear) [Tetrahymena thermophila SB210]|uniref:Uncharacterized protein n=1 Tax=Tetrahymena thermophila (strain SB210) TaxID=312017 RepID=I7MIA0_TETTS|nr:hypothetical protein TTHERM_00298290 [Tetrahymena thermophila SB210]EAS04218.2 hypothetical protein TTHERM_00298290 [Tetrahymena thermophila SB210]|eukprot:XP_001024463.2 hypothetical protein TTHERM_00298290 [Tetrahymena thermophila SB210]